MPRIPGGFVLMPRIFYKDKLNGASACAREVFYWLFLEANHAPRESSGRLILPGQTVRTYKDIQEALAWYVGFRKEHYSEHRFEAAMKQLTKRKLVTTTKTTRGLLITICDYVCYQNPKNYESQIETDNEDRTKTTRRPDEDQTINNELNELNNKKETNSRMPSDFVKNVIFYLNEKARKRFRTDVSETKRCIKARYTAGFRLADFKHVIDTKAEQWSGDFKMDRYLRPQTLFGTNFESYLNESDALVKRAKPSAVEQFDSLPNFSR
jgi:uncharacterized phage protein (TIGR02220 family)